MKILFMCVANSARSQLAEGLAKSIFPEAHVMSAGSHPGGLNPLAVRVMAEIGLDISAQYSKSLDDLSPESVASLDHVVTLCAEEVCPIIVAKGAKRHHWPFPDPVSREPIPDSERLERFREARDAIRSRLTEFKRGIER